MKRNNSFDLLRCIATLMVILLHVSANKINNYESSTSWTIAIFGATFSAVAVPIFVMLSGHFILSSPIKDLKSYYIKTQNSIVAPIIVWTIISGLLFSAMGNIGDFVQGLKRGAPFYHIWYMYMVVWLYILAPLFLLIKKRLGDYMLSIVGFIFLIASIPFSYILELHFPLNFLSWIGYFILGYSLPKFIGSFSVDRCNYLVCYFIFSLITFGGSIYTYHNMDESLILYNYQSPTVIVAALGLFLFFYKTTIKRCDFYKFSKYNLDVYMCHAFVLMAILKIEKAFLPNLFHSSWSILVNFIVVTLVCFFSIKFVGYKACRNLYNIFRIKYE